MNGGWYKAECKSDVPGKLRPGPRTKSMKMIHLINAVYGRL